MKITRALFIATTVFLAMPSVSFASEQDVRAQCFSTLKENMSEATLFATPIKTLQSMSYAELEPKFSINYKSLESFGLQIDRGDLEMRLYSFGRQTGYIHPAKLPLPSKEKSDIWKEPAKEFIVAEEFIKDSEGNKHFLDCFFLTIASDNLMAVTRDRYLYDGPMSSLTKIAKDGSYKAWYSSDASFDYSGTPFVEWKRLFIYPKATQNTYFNRYDVAEDYPDNKVESFDALKFFLDVTRQIQVPDSSGILLTTKYFNNTGGTNVEIYPPKELIPPVVSGQTAFDIVFPLAGYYQAIQDKFPVFAERLSINGALKYDTFKKLFAIELTNPNAAELLSGLTVYKDLAIYSLNKTIGAKGSATSSDPQMEKLLLDIKNADSIATQILAEDEAKKVAGQKQKLTFEVAGGAAALIAAFSLIVFLKRRNNKNVI